MTQKYDVQKKKSVGYKLHELYYAVGGKTSKCFSLPRVDGSHNDRLSGQTARHSAASTATDRQEHRCCLSVRDEREGGVFKSHGF